MAQTLNAERVIPSSSSHMVYAKVREPTLRYPALSNPTIGAQPDSPTLCQRLGEP